MLFFVCGLLLLNLCLLCRDERQRSPKEERE